MQQTMFSVHTPPISIGGITSQFGDNSHIENGSVTAEPICNCFWLSLLVNSHDERLLTCCHYKSLQTISGPLYILSQGAMTGKEQGHATQAHVAPPEAHGGFVAGRRVDLGVCVQIVHTWQPFGAVQGVDPDDWENKNWQIRFYWQTKAMPVYMYIHKKYIYI